MTLVCVPITVESHEQAVRDAVLAAEHGADLVELRIDAFASHSDPESDACAAQVRAMLGEVGLPVILTCRHADEGGAYDGDETDRVSLLEAICVNAEHPPAYLDFELAAYRASANLRQKIDFCVAHPGQQREVSTRLILSMHDFDGRPADLTRRLLDAWSEPAAAVVKFAFRARSIRDNLEIFEILRDAPKPTIGLGMGEFGLMSRVLAPKFGGYLTFASLRDSAATAPGQPTIRELLEMYRFRSIGRDTKLYGVIGWPVTQSMGPLIHNAGFEAAGHDGVYLPLPVAADPDDPEATRASFKATAAELLETSDLDFGGASVTIPYKEQAAQLGDGQGTGAVNTIWPKRSDAGTAVGVANTDSEAVVQALASAMGDVAGRNVGIIGAGGAAFAAASAVVSRGGTAVVYNRTRERADALVEHVRSAGAMENGKVVAAELGLLPRACCEAFINATPVGMTDGPDPEGVSIPVGEMANLTEDTVFFDTVYNPIDTPMLKAAREHGCRTIDGVQMFVRQAAAQFEQWTGEPAPVELFDRLVRERLGASDDA